MDHPMPPAMPGKPSDPLSAFRVEQARKLLADIKAIDYRDDRAPYFLLGSAEVVIAGLLAVVEGAGR